MAISVIDGAYIHSLEVLRQMVLNLRTVPCSCVGATEIRQGAQILCSQMALPETTGISLRNSFISCSTQDTDTLPFDTGARPLPDHVSRNGLQKCGEELRGKILEYAGPTPC